MDGRTLKGLGKILLSCLSIYLLSGCGVTIKTTAYLDQTPGLAAPREGASFAVLENQQAANPLFDREVRSKIEKLLVRRGYQLEVPDKADYELTYGYALTEGVRRGTTTVFGPPKTEILVMSDAQGGTRVNTITVPGDATVVPRVFEAYTKQLSISVFDAADFRKYNKTKVIWVGEASITDSSTDLRTMMDYLLVASFMHFGRDTGKQVTLSLSDDNADIQYLRTATNKPRSNK